MIRRHQTVFRVHTTHLISGQNIAMKISHVSSIDKIMHFFAKPKKIILLSLALGAENIMYKTSTQTSQLCITYTAATFENKTHNSSSYVNGTRREV